MANPPSVSANQALGHAQLLHDDPRFLANLEGLKRFAGVKLKSTERIKGEKVEKETGIAANRKDLVRFQMAVTE